MLIEDFVVGELKESGKVCWNHSYRTLIMSAYDRFNTGDKVQLIGFGSFAVTKRLARMGMDFRTKKSVVIPASNGIKFKCRKILKEAVNN